MIGARAGARQGRQGTHRAAGALGGGGDGDVSRRAAAWRQYGRMRAAMRTLFLSLRGMALTRQWVWSLVRSLNKHGDSAQAAAQLRHAHGGARRGSAHRYRRCWAMRTLRRRRCIRMWRWDGCRRCCGSIIRARRRHARCSLRRLDAHRNDRRRTMPRKVCMSRNKFAGGVEDFLRVLRMSAGASAHTVRAYARELREFAALSREELGSGANVKRCGAHAHPRVSGEAV